MYQFVDLRNTGIEARFAFFDTAPDWFVRYDGDETWNTWEEFEKSWSHENERTAPPEPTPDQCELGERIEHDGRVYFATWYPQMGGYGSRCLVETYGDTMLRDNDPDGCFDVWVWHDGAWPFTDDDDDRGRKPAHLHHCSPEQFVDFGVTVSGFMSKGAEPDGLRTDDVALDAYFAKGKP
jgi:hypothetical protein